MKAKDKEIIYNLIKSASSHILAYTPSEFSNQPIFSNDPEIPSENEIQKPLEKIEETDRSSNKKTINFILEKIQNCNRCSLAKSRNKVIPGQGVENPLVLIIGDAPSYNEDMEGKPFVAEEGNLLDKMLAAIDLDRNKNCYITNVVKCRPEQNRDPYSQEKDACFSFLETQIHILKPKMILCMGRISFQTLLKNEEKLEEARQKFYEYEGIPLMVTYPPRELLKDISKKRPAWEDLKMFKRKLDELI